MMQTFFIPVGRLFRCIYPSANFKGVRRRRMEVRRLILLSVRDTRVEPLEAATIAAEPDLCREGFLVRCYDLDRLGERWFWTGSMQEVELMSDDENHSVVWIHDADDGRFPDAYEVEGICIEQISLPMANVIADGGNAFLKKLGDDSRRLAVVDWNVPRMAS